MYFRHAPTAFWAAVVVLLGALAALGFAVSQSGPSPASAVAAPSTAPVADVELLVTRMPGVYPALASGTGRSWARDFSELAREGRSRYEESSARPDLAEEWLDVTVAAEQLALQDPSDTRAFTAYAGALGAAVGRLQAAYVRLPGMP